MIWLDGKVGVVCLWLYLLNSFLKKFRLYVTWEWGWMEIKASGVRKVVVYHWRYWRWPKDRRCTADVCENSDGVWLSVSSSKIETRLISTGSFSDCLEKGKCMFHLYRPFLLPTPQLFFPHFYFEVELLVRFQNGFILARQRLWFSLLIEL